MDHLHNIVVNTIKMIIARGYDVSKYEDILTMNIEEFTQYITNILGKNVNYSNSELRRACNMECPHKKDRSRKILAFFTAREKGEKFVNSKNINELIVNHKKFSEIILITSSNFAPGSKEKLSTIMVPINYFYDHDLNYCVIERHEYHPHYLLNEEEAAQFLRDNNVKKSQLPQMLTTDAIAKFYNFRPDSIIRIDRNDYGVSVLTPHTTNYRLVVKKER